MSGLSFSSRASEVWAGGLSIRRCRGWPLAPPTAGPGRASRAGVSRPRLLADREGPRRGSPCPVAAGGACGLGRGGARARIRPPAGPASKKASRSETDEREHPLGEGKRTALGMAIVIPVGGGEPPCTALVFAPRRQ